MDNYWIGSEELVIVFNGGTYEVISSEEEDPVFTGSYEKCKEFCDTQVDEYAESLF